ncbi:MAG TPA: nitroreductase family protein [Acidimicrobiales bacterium]|nr:nitroreductase family protein [Acidimicrobiales bacterium]
MDALDAIFNRRSIGRLAPPAPSDADVVTILRAAAAAPDHGELRPFRFTVLDGDAQTAFGSVLEQAYVARCRETGREPEPARAEKERTKLGRAPLVIVVSAVDQEHEKIPFVEQRDAAVAAAQNALVAATALGYGSMWRTGSPVDDHRVKAALGLREKDAIVGFLYLGTIPPGTSKPRRDPDLDGLITDLL